MLRDSVTVLVVVVEDEAKVDERVKIREVVSALYWRLGKTMVQEGRISGQICRRTGYGHGIRYPDRHHRTNGTHYTRTQRIRQPHGSLSITSLLPAFRDMRPIRSDSSASSAATPQYNTASYSTTPPHQAPFPLPLPYDARNSIGLATCDTRFILV